MLICLRFIYFVSGPFHHVCLWYAAEQQSEQLILFQSNLIESSKSITIKNIESICVQALVTLTQFIYLEGIEEEKRDKNCTKVEKKRLSVSVCFQFTDE